MQPAPRVRLTDVSPRDGLQNEPLRTFADGSTGPIPTADKVALIARLLRTGVDEIEVTSFVSPRWVPQLADGASVCRGVAGLDELVAARASGVVLSALVPNEQGLVSLLGVNDAAAVALGSGAPPLLGKVSVFTAASETFSRRNTNGSVDEVLERLTPVVDGALGAGLAVRGYVSCAVACPFEGPVLPSRVASVVARLVAMGVDEIDVADTIGVATPEDIDALLPEVMSAMEGRSETRGGEPSLTLHLHDTHGRAASCVGAALSLGVRSFDGSAAGLGGCPFASTPDRRAPGNIATGTLVGAIREAGYRAGWSRAIDHDRLAEASVLASMVRAGRSIAHV